MAVLPATFVEEKTKGGVSFGEKAFNFLTYGVMGTAGTFVASVGVTFWAQRRHADTWKKVSDNISTPLIKAFNITDSRKQEGVRGTANDLLLSLALMMGGNLFVLPIGLMETNKQKIVHALNTKFSSEKDTAKGDADVENQPMVKFGPLIKSRLIAWATVFVSIKAAKGLFPKGFNSFVEKGEHIAIKAMRNKGQTLEAEQLKDVKNIGGNSAIDIFATIACTSMLYLFSKAFSRKEAANLQAPKSSDSVTEMPQSAGTIQGETNPEDRTVTQKDQSRVSRHQDKVVESRSRFAEVQI